jgi:hypothetical protein
MASPKQQRDSLPGSVLLSRGRGEQEVDSLLLFRRGQQVGVRGSAD